MIQKIAKNLKRASHLKDYLSGNEAQISFYDIVYAIESDSFLQKEINELDINVTMAFTNKEDAISNSGENSVVAIMLGKLIQETCSDECINLIGLNYNNGKFDNFVFIPFFDKLTKQYLISPTDESIALLSIDQKSHRHMGVQATFFSINNKYMPEDIENRGETLGSIVEDLSFMIPRISQPKGSANILCLLLNLENKVEEKAFIRMYKTLDEYTEVLFVTSELKLQTGELEEIQYNGANLEGIYTPIIKRQS